MQEAINNSDVIKSTSCLDNIIPYLCAVLGFAIPTSTALTNIAVISIIILLPFSKRFNKQYLNSPLCLSIILFITLSLILAIRTTDNFNNSFNTILRTSRLLLIPAIAMCLTDKKSKKFAITAFIAGVFLGSIQYIYAFKFRHNYIVAERYLINGIQIYKDRIFTSTFLAYTFFMCYTFAINSAHRVKFYLIATASFLLLFLGVDGRTGHIIFYTLIATLLALNFNKKNIFLALTIVICSILILKLSSFSNRWDEISPELNSIIKTYNNNNTEDSHNSTSIIERYQFVKDTINFIKQKPILGWGTGYYSKVQKQFYPNRASDNPHNQYLLVVTEMGLLGLACLILVFWQIFKLSFKLPKQERDLSIGIIITIMVGSLANSWLMDFTSLHFFVFILGFCYANHLGKANTLKNEQ